MRIFYPLKFVPIYKEMLWGGNRLNKYFNRNSPYEKTGESWDVSCRPGEMGVIENGPAAGQDLVDYIAQDWIGVLGTRLKSVERFPLLVKLIDANDNLSVQVHPGDDYAQQFHNNFDALRALYQSCSEIGAAAKGRDGSGGQWQPTDTGKTEMWYILTPPTDGELIIGLKPGVTPDGLRLAFESGDMEPCLNRLPVSAGDIVNIPAGLVHALTPGAMVAEVQQNSDITYRMYDYNRVGPDGKPRALHLDEALAVADFEGRIPRAVTSGLAVKKGDCTLTYTIANPYFAVIKYELNCVFEEDSDPAAFSIFTCVEGEAEIIAPGASGEAAQPGDDAMVVDLPTGSSVFIPAGLGGYAIRSKGGRAVLLKSFVPDVQKDFITPLKAYGYTDDEIAASTAVGL